VKRGVSKKKVGEKVTGRKGTKEIKENENERWDMKAQFTCVCAIKV
jgi:hypothetical protein